MRENIILVGGGGHCHSVIDVVEQENKYTIVGIIDNVEFVGLEVLGYPVIGCDADLQRIFSKCKNAIITVGHVQSNSIRLGLYNKLKKIGYFLPVIVSPIAYISKHSLVGEGTVIMHHAIINANAKIGKNCIINTKSLIEHDAVIYDNCHISTGSIVNGKVLVRENTFYGSNATSKQGIECQGFIKAGSVVK